jgi:hypothetical protein
VTEDFVYGVVAQCGSTLVLGGGVIFDAHSVDLFQSPFAIGACDLIRCLYFSSCTVESQSLFISSEFARLNFDGHCLIPSTPVGADSAFESTGSFVYGGTVSNTPFGGSRYLSVNDTFTGGRGEGRILFSEIRLEGLIITQWQEMGLVLFASDFIIARRLMIVDVVSTSWTLGVREMLGLEGSVAATVFLDDVFIYSVTAVSDSTVLLGLWSRIIAVLQRHVAATCCWLDACLRSDIECVHLL